MKGIHVAKESCWPLVVLLDLTIKTRDPFHSFFYPAKSNYLSNSGEEVPSQHTRQSVNNLHALLTLPRWSRLTILWSVCFSSNTLPPALESHARLLPANKASSFCVHCVVPVISLFKEAFRQISCFHRILQGRYLKSDLKSA